MPRLALALTLTLALVAAAAPANASAAPRIANGTGVSTARHAELWPFIVSIGTPGSNALDGHVCGGSLIAPRLVLTAAHCVEDIDEEGDLVRSAPGGRMILAGVPQLSAQGSGQWRRVSDVFIHPKWNTTTTRNDVAVLRLASPMRSNSRVRTIQIAAATEDTWWGAGAGLAASPATGPWIAGWGNTSLWDVGESYPDVLREASIPIASDAACASPDDPGMGSFDGGIDTRQFFCAGVPDSDSDAGNGSTGLDSCSGDSGGPIIVGDGAGQWRLAGLVSFGGKCGATNYTAYTRLASYRSWIASVPATGGGPGGIQPVSRVRTLRRTSSTATIAWNGPARAAKSFVVYVDIGGGGMMRFTTSTRRAVTLRGLESNSDYVFWVGARTARGDLSPLRRIATWTKP